MNLRAILRRFNPSYVPIHCSIVRAVDTLLRTILPYQPTTIENMNTEQAVSIIEAAKSTIITTKDVINRLHTELADLRDKQANNDAVVQSLNGQINSLVEADAVVDAKLAGLAELVPPVPETVTPEPEGVTPERAAEIEFEAGAATARAGLRLLDEASEAARRGYASVQQPVDGGIPVGEPLTTDPETVTPEADTKDTSSASPATTDAPKEDDELPPA